MGLTFSGFADSIKPKLKNALTFDGGGSKSRKVVHLYLVVPQGLGRTSCVWH